MRSHALIVVAAVLTLATAARAETVNYTVIAGDTCESVSLKFWGDAKRYDKLHELNPQMGPQPHKLVAGTVLRVNKAGPEAKVTFVRNSVEAATPSAHPAVRNEPLMTGHKVSTLGNSNAEVTFNDATRLQLGEHTLVVILGGTRTATRTAEDTTLVKGTLSAFLGEVGAQAAPLKLATPAGRIDLTGRSKVSVDGAAATRLAVYQGRSSITAVGKKVDVAEGFGSKAEQGKAPTPPRPLPAAPVWSTLPPSVSLTTGPEVEVAGTYKPGIGVGPQVATWHLQLARDEAFNDLVLDANVGAEIVELRAKNVVEGAYFARVSGVDADSFEGPFSALAAVQVVRPKISPAAPGKRASIEVPSGLFCAIDQGPLAIVSAPIPLFPAAAHVVACASKEDATRGPDLKVGADVSGAATVVAEAGALEQDARGKKRVVKIKLTDASGAPLRDAKIAAGDASGALVEAPTESSEGTYTAVARWKGEIRSTTLPFVINGVQPFEVSLPGGPPAVRPPPPPPPRLYEAAVLGLAQLQPSTTGFGFGAEIGTRRPIGKLALALALRATYERHVEDDRDVTCDGAGPTSSCATSAQRKLAHASSSAFVLGLPLSLRFRPMGAGWFPYVSVSPQLLIDRAADTRSGTLSASGRLTESTTQVDLGVRAAVSGSLGVQASCGAFLELGARVATDHGGAIANPSFNGFLGSLGYRFAL